MGIKQITGLMGLTTLLILSGCSTNGGTSNGGEEEGSTTTIGGIAPLTGDGASYGIELQRIAEMALADVNAAWSEEGMTLDIQWEDGACNGNDGATAAQKLVGVDKVEVILGGFCSSETLAAAPITEAAGVLLFSPGSSNPSITDAGEYVFRDWPSDAFQGQKLAELANELGYKTVAILTEQQDYAVGISTVFKTTYEGMGGTVVEETYLSEDTDFKTQLTKLKDQSPDVYFVNPQTPVKADVVLKQMQELGITGPFLLNDVAGTSTDLLTTYSDYLEGSYTATVSIDETSEDVMKLKNRYKEMYGADITYLAYMTAVYDGVWILANGIAEVGNDGDAMKGYLNDLEGYTGLMGTTTFDENGDPLTGHSIFVIQGGTMVKK